MTALLNNFNMAEDVVRTSVNSAGSALAENEKVLESIVGHINKFKAAFEAMSASVVKSDFVKTIIDIGTALVTVVDKLFEMINAIGGLKTILGGLAMYTVFSGKLSSFAISLGKIIPIAGQLIMLFTKFGPVVGGAKDIIAANGSNALVAFFQSAKTAGVGAAVSFTSVAAAILAIVAAVKLYQRFNPSFDALSESAAAAKEELSILEDKLNTNLERVRELQKLSKENKLSFVEEDELNRLQSENELLESQIALRKASAEAKSELAAEKAREEIGYFINGADEQSSIDNVLSMYKDDMENYGEASDILDGLIARQDKLIEMQSALDPVADKELIKQIDITLDKIAYATGDATALASIWDKVWSSGSPVQGAKDMAVALKDAATYQKELNDQLAEYGGNVDIKNRKMLGYEDVAGNSAFSNVRPGDIVTLDSQTFSVNDWSGDGDVVGTAAISVTPILPDGTVFDSQEAFEEYIASLRDGKGGFDVSKDTKGIVLAVVDEGDIDKSIELAEKLAYDAHIANQEFLDLYQSGTAQDVLTYLQNVGVDISSLTAGELADMFEQLENISSAVDSTDSSFKSLYTTVESLSEKKSLLNSLKEDMSDGGISDSTLKSLHEQYTAMDETIAQYRLGLATAQDVYNEYEKLYKDDEENLLSATRWKIGLSEDFFNESVKGSAEWVKILGSYYTTDYENYKELAQKKVDLETALQNALNEGWRERFKTYADAVRATAAVKYNSKSVFERSPYLAKEYGTYENYVNEMSGGLLDTAELFDAMALKLAEDIKLELRDPEGSGTSSKVSAYIADIDAYREAIERLNRTKLNVETLDDKIGASNDIRETISLRSQLIDTYQSEIEAQETLNKLRREGLADGADKLRGIGFDVTYNAATDKFFVNNLEHINELVAKSKGEYKTVQEATNALRKETEEYIKDLEALNEANQDGEKNWRSLSKSIHDAKSTIVDDLKGIVSTSSEALDSIQSVYDTLRNAAKEYSDNSGFISIDTFQSIVDLGPQYMQYLKDENGLLTITREKIESVIAAKVEQLSLDNAMTYVERLRLALQSDSIEELNDLLYATTDATNATWGLVYANLAMLDLSDDQREAALHNVDAMRSLAENAKNSIGLESMKSGLDDIIKYTMDMLKSRIDQQKDALEGMKDAYAELIDLKKKSLEESKSEADHQKDVAKKLKEIAKLQARIDALSLDTSREAQAERAKLAEELASLQEDLDTTQRDHAIDKQQEALDKMQSDYEDQKDAEIDALEKTVSSEEKLYRMAIEYISDNWDTLYDELIAWNTEYGSSINKEITSAWEEAKRAVEQYGDAIRAVSSLDGGNGDVVGKTGEYEHGSSVREQVMARITKMKANSAAWGSASESKRDELYRENIGYANEISDLIGEDVVIDKNGVWRIGSVNGEELYKKYAGTYHTGGIVGNAGSLKENEALAKLENGEIVVSNQNKRTLLSLIDFVSDLKKTIGMKFSRDYRLGTDADSVRQLTNVTNNRAGDIRLGDVYIYGADASTVEKHKAVNREFANEILKQLHIKR